jgi:hypothetical protein
MSSVAAVVALLAGLSCALHAGELPISPVCWPLHFAGITLGVSTESQVERLLGQGVVRDNDGDIGRYYVDPGKKATLHLTFSDSQVEELTVEQGVTQELKAAELARATSKWFDPYESFGNWGALHLGSSKQDVLQNLGAPKEGKDSDSWEYQSACACELPEYFTLYFRSGRMYKVVFSAPSG